MVDKAREILNSFSFFINVLNFFCISKFINHKNEKVEKFKRFISLLVTFFRIWLAHSGYVNTILVSYDSLTKFAQSVDRSSTVLVAAGIFLDATFRPKKDFKIYKNFLRIDEILASKFEISVDYAKIRIMLYTFQIFAALIFMFLTKLFLEIEHTCFDLLMFHIFTILMCINHFVELFYIVIVVHIYSRVKKIEKILSVK
jgi:hypothetical protein